MPEISNVSLRRSLVTRPAYPASSATLSGRPAARRTPASPPSFLVWLRSLLGMFDVRLEVSTGSECCDLCLEVYDDEAEHVCVRTGYCKRCNWRQILDGDVCSFCRGGELVLVRRGR